MLRKNNSIIEDIIILDNGFTHINERIKPIKKTIKNQ